MDATVYSVAMVWTINGGSGQDRLWGRNDNDRLNGGNSNDRLYGEQGNDTLNGGRNNDVLNGGAGDDYVIGGNGSDKFVVHAGHDTIADFQNNRDTIDVSETLTTLPFKAYVDSHATVVGGNTILTDDVSASVTVRRG